MASKPVAIWKPQNLRPDDDTSVLVLNDSTTNPFFTASIEVMLGLVTRRNAAASTSPEKAISRVLRGLCGPPLAYAAPPVNRFWPLNPA